ncbi:MAG: ATP-grasp domain-containing protein [Actinomycetota bacterium]|nr:ATP-grasp domain-containing protein [Actinomycetota bacterium]
MTSDQRSGDRLVFVESNLTGTGMQALRIAGELGLRTVFATADLSRYTADPDAERVIGEEVEQVLVCDTLDPVAVEKCVLDNGLQPVGVMTVGEYYVPTATAVARGLGLPGLDPAAALTARDKLKMRTACLRASVPVPRFRFVGSVADVDDVIDEIGLPCVIKPTDESASVGVSLCRTREQLRLRVGELVAVTHNSRGQAHVPGGLVEECLFGPEVSVETFTFGGQTTVLGVTDKILAQTPYFLETGHTFPSILPASVTGPAIDVALAALRAIDFDFGPAHTEVKLTARGPVLIEINPRTGGDNIPDLVREATGVSLLEQSIAAHSGRTPDLRPSRRGGAAIRFLTGRDGIVDEVVGEELREWFPSVISMRIKAKPGKVTRWPTNSHDRLGHLMTGAESPHEAAAQADAALTHLTVTYRPNNEGEPS